MVTAVDPVTLAKWQAVALVDGWGEDNERAARICAAVHNAIMVAAAKQGGEVSEDDFKDPDEFLPKFKFERKAKPATVQTPEQMIAIGKSIAGIR